MNTNTPKDDGGPAYPHLEPRPMAVPCPNAAGMGEHQCKNASQCWEPCGELGHSAEHARVSTRAQPVRPGLVAVFVRLLGNLSVDWVDGYEPKEGDKLYTTSQQVQPAPRGTDAQIRLERELTASAIVGAMAYGYQNGEYPPDDADWLRPFWEMGRRDAERESAIAQPVQPKPTKEQMTRYRKKPFVIDAVQGEPVGFVEKTMNRERQCGPVIWTVDINTFPCGTQLYTTPQPAQEGDAKDAQTIESNLWTIKEWAYLHLGAMHNITIAASSAHTLAAIESKKATQ